MLRPLLGAILCVIAAFGVPASPALAASGTNVWPPTPAADLPLPEGASTFDPATGQLLRTNGAQTWSWDGTRWAQLAPALAPALRMAPTLAYDSATHRVVMFGGMAEATELDLRDTWTWNGITWVQAQPATSPGARKAACAGYDTASKQFIMFGGTLPSTNANLADTWSWTGTDWVQLHPVTNPPGGACAMTYDPEVGGLALVTLGPPLSDGTVLPQLWIWNGSDWAQVASSLPDSVGVPSLAYAADAQALIADDAAFHADGGYNNNVWGGVESEEWRWTGGSWVMLGTTTLETKLMEAGTLVDDTATHQLVLETDGGTRLCTSSGSSTVTPLRLSGDTRVATAVAVSQSAFSVDGSASAVVLARADTFADALAGGPLAAAKNGPLLLTSSAGLDDATKAEIARVLKPGGTVYLLGGESALSAAVASAVSALGDVPVRLAGNDRFGTALAIANEMGNPSTVFEASGVSFADALSAVPAAVANHGVVLLTNGTSLTSATSAYLSAHPGLHYAIGGPAATADPSAIALAGADRYATSQAVASALFADATGVSLASGTAFPDALAGGPASGAAGFPVLLVPAAGTLPEPDVAYLSTRNGDVNTLQVLGGTAAVAASVVDSAVATLAGS